MHPNTSKRRRVTYCIDITDVTEFLDSIETSPMDATDLKELAPWLGSQRDKYRRAVNLIQDRSPLPVARQAATDSYVG